MEHRAWSKADLAALLALVIGACISLAWLVPSWYEADIATNDASIYILCAKSLIAGDGYSYLGQPFTLRPPGFPALIAPLIAWRGVDFFALNLCVSLFGVLGVALLFAWTRPRLGALVSFSVAAAVWLNPVWRRSCSQVMSDVPGAALGIACLLIEDWARRGPPERSIRRDVVTGLSIGLAALVRSMNVLILPAALAARCIDRYRAKSAGSSWIAFARASLIPIAGATLIVLLPWSLRNEVHHPPPPAEQNYLYSYSTAMWHTDGGDPSSPLRPLSVIPARIPPRSLQLVSLLGSRMQSGTYEPAISIAGALVLACALFGVLRRPSTAGLFMCGASLILLVFVVFADRHALPVYLIAFATCAEAALAFLASLHLPVRPRSIVVASLVALLAGVDLDPHAGWDEIEHGHAQFLKASAEVEPRLALDARIAAPTGWHYSVYLDRPVYSLIFAARRAKSMQGAQDVLDKNRIDTVVLFKFMEDYSSMFAWFKERYQNIEETPSATIIRVRQ